MRLASPERLRSFIGPEAEKKMSGRTLARRVINPDTGKPIHPSFIDHLLTGRRRSCTPRIAEQISEALEVPLEILFVPEAASTKQSNSKRGAA